MIDKKHIKLQGTKASVMTTSIMFGIPAIACRAKVEVVITHVASWQGKIFFNTNNTFKKILLLFFQFLTYISVFSKCGIKE